MVYIKFAISQVNSIYTKIFFHLSHSQTLTWYVAAKIA